MSGPHTEGWPKPYAAETGDGWPKPARTPEPTLADTRYTRDNLDRAETLLDESQSGPGRYTAETRAEMIAYAQARATMAVAEALLVIADRLQDDVAGTLIDIKDAL